MNIHLRITISEPSHLWKMQENNILYQIKNDRRFPLSGMHTFNKRLTFLDLWCAVSNCWTTLSVKNIICGITLNEYICNFKYIDTKNVMTFNEFYILNIPWTTTCRHIDIYDIIIDDKFPLLMFLTVSYIMSLNISYEYTLNISKWESCTCINKGILLGGKQLFL